MPGTEHARLAVGSDLGHIELIAAEVAEQIGDHRGGALFLRRESGGSARIRATALIDDPSGVVVVGTFDGCVLGYGLGVVETLNDEGLLGLIDDLVVLPAAREVGIGEAMMNLLLTQFRSKGCFGVDSRALPGDRHTKNFFESFGLKARLLVVHKSLADD